MKKTDLFQMKGETRDEGKGVREKGKGWEKKNEGKKMIKIELLQMRRGPRAGRSKQGKKKWGLKKKLRYVLYKTNTPQ